jgi:hypothetical protein
VYIPELAVTLPDSPVKKPRTQFSIKFREPNPGELSSIYPWYHGNDNVNDPAELVKQRHRGDSQSKGSKDSEMTDACEVDDDATIVEEESRLNRLPVGLNLEDLQDPAERAKFKKRMEVASSTAVLVQSLDSEQVMWFLSEIKVCFAKQKSGRSPCCHKHKADTKI